ncbi:MAG: anti-sigma factor antagonist [Clostridia bacterium]|nr:anti-sigma factor antagonist [Clostridia bacterium]
MPTEFREKGDALIVSLSGEVDQYAAAILKRKIDLEIEATRKKRLIFDLAKVTFMDSSGIGLIIGRYRLLSPIGGRIYLCGATRRVKKIVEISGLKKIAKCCRSVDCALKKEV